MRKVKLQNRQLLADTGRRLATLFSTEMKISVAEAARRLKYESPATLYAARDGKTIPHPEKLIGIMDLFQEETGKKLDLHWLLTGQGEPVYRSRQGERLPKDDDIIAKMKALNPHQKQALWLLLGINA
jgi:hypothetical protein